ncbi:zinc metalloprotease [Erythrobacter sp. HI0019]|uniref:KPN_02809 family neutral zinc metallopeptidase n=1 Tax=unclassified Erythrobacter TaxID=2633097 RepID=UPI0007BA98E4|nr:MULTISPECIES: neutral zinc metallopeptidase [unclassified Erythrobacter]KZX86038.1 zinc metalloprotease [Erythrobacter sp. HI0019]KZY10332.1 zinc metalloprotease [Erythrobacter sp. HI0028]
MRLNPFNTNNINVRSSGGGVPGGKAGGIGCGTIVIAAIGYFVFGLDPMQTAGMVEGVQQGQQQAGPANTDEQEVCTSSEYALEACNGLQSLNQTWAATFDARGYGDQFQQPTLDLYGGGGVRTGCGNGTSAMGPFYCPADQTIYIDTSFYDTLERQLGAGGDFARYYVLAHEYGHHIQTITGISGQIRSAQQQNPSRANQLQVLMELQADCYAGVWAGKNRNLIEPGDIEEGMNAAAAIGDDRLTGGRVSSENFTHGTSQQRSDALRLGLQGDDRACDRITNIG